VKIVVTTPTGNVGTHVVRLLLQAGVRPTLFLRDPSKLDHVTAALSDVMQGDQGDTEAVVDVTRDADALFWVDPPAPGADPLATYALMGENVARAVRLNDIGRTVFQSSVGAEKRHGAGEIDGLARTETLLDEADATVIHLRCGYFFSNLLLDPGALEEGVIRVTMPLDAPMPWVAPQDIAAVAVARLLSTDWAGREIQAVHGPEDLSWEQATAIVSAVTGKPLRAERISDDAMREGLRGAGMSDKQVEAIIGMSAGLREDFTPEQARDVVTTTPTTLAAWAAQHLR
jgi:uncharacterized protein YbjT (DUF2867 family)